ncbi:Nuclear envelope phosphatase-regulatory subunit 1 [Apodemus speciosus]|uniref:Nuclear envelope phosphatase-regulatory subunit 1 n=1 Tax=Apodemus speciosus TaxID=105296 RepID=A0ABQ0F2E2_APOSI
MNSLEQAEEISRLSKEDLLNIFIACNLPLDAGELKQEVAVVLPRTTALEVLRAQNVEESPVNCKSDSRSTVIKCCSLWLCLLGSAGSVLLIVVSVCTATGAWNWLIDPETQKRCPSSRPYGTTRSSPLAV